MPEQLLLAGQAFALRAQTPVLTQHRSYPSQFQVTGLPGSKVRLRGYASITGRGYDMHDAHGVYVETVRSGAFDATLKADPDVAFLLNHGGLTMARTRSGSLTLGADSTGLHTDAELNSARSDVADLLRAIEDGDVDEMSFAFRIPDGGQEWTADFTRRDITAVDIHRGDVSAVNFGANPFTSIGMRGLTAADAGRLSRMLTRASHQSGAPATSSVVGQLQHVLALIATADQALDLAQPMLAQVLGVPNPDDDPDDSSADGTVAASPSVSDGDLVAPATGQRSSVPWGLLEVLRLQHAHQRTR